MKLFDRVHGDGGQASSPWSIRMVGEVAHLTNVSAQTTHEVVLSGVWKATSGTPRTTWDEIEPGATVDFAFEVAADATAPEFNVQWLDEAGALQVENVPGHRPKA